METLQATSIADLDRIVRRAGAVLAAGGLVAIPTETVYGLAADAASDRAVARIFAAKGRPDFNPLIVHVTDLAMAERFAVLPELAFALARDFWPGPLTLVAARRKDAPLSPLVYAGLETIALRAPAHPVARAVIAALGRPIAAPSANPSGKVSATTAAHVAESLGAHVDLIIDWGPSAIGLESTIIGVDGDGARLLRPGGVPAEALEARLGRPLLRAGDGVIAAPGMMASHYAPSAPLRLNADHPEPGEFFLGFGERDSSGENALNLSPYGNLREAGANLFDYLRRADKACAERGLRGIAVAPIPQSGIGEAICDRLRRAAAPRSEET